jgi:hypothetical protein
MSPSERWAGRVGVARTSPEVGAERSQLRCPQPDGSARRALPRSRLALSGRVLGDIGDPELVRALAGKPTVDDVTGERGLMRRSPALAPWQAGQIGAAYQQLDRPVTDRNAQPES